MNDILGAILAVLVAGLAGYIFVLPTLLSTRKRKQKAVESIPVQVLYVHALESSTASFIRWAAKRVYQEWGDNRSYHSLIRHYYTVTGYQFDPSIFIPSPSYELVVEELGRDALEYEDDAE